MLQLALVMAGGAIGAGARHVANVVGLRAFGPGFPVATLSVNVIGGLLMGLLAGWFASRHESSSLLRLFLATGLLGGFTTFSAFSLDVVLLWERGQPATALGYAAGSVVLSVLALVAGLALTRAVA